MNRERATVGSDRYRALHECKGSGRGMPLSDIMSDGKALCPVCGHPVKVSKRNGYLARHNNVT